MSELFALKVDVLEAGFEQVSQRQNCYESIWKTGALMEWYQSAVVSLNRNRSKGRNRGELVTRPWVAKAH